MSSVEFTHPGRLGGPPSLPVGLGPSGVAYVSSVGEVFVANTGSENLSVINDTNNTIVRSIPVGLDPTALLSIGQYLYVANANSSKLSSWSPVDVNA